MPVAWEKLWYDDRPASLLLIPFSWLLCGTARARRAAYRWGLLRQQAAGAPVIIIGNLTAGGTGKTPLVIWLARYLRQRGWRPGIVSRGYGGHATHWPQQVRPDSDPVVVGDEAVLIARHAGCPMAVAPDRVLAARALVEHHQVNVIVSDDGLQHYRLRRDIEVLVVDGLRRFGNGRCIPAGPLREPLARAAAVDLVVAQGAAQRGEHPMRLQGSRCVNLAMAGRSVALEEFAGKAVHAVAGVAHPQRFFDYLRRKGLRIVEHVFEDHHAFRAADLEFGDAMPVLMTEKDAVKCERFAAPHHWCLPVEAEMDDAFGYRLLALLKERGFAPSAAIPA
jgi:tetraacyldisaccharide 4'-kinase